jgi:hypothetical protein
MKHRKIDRLIELKVKVFDTVRKLEILQHAINQIAEVKNKDLKELEELEGKIKDRYPRAKKLVNK